MAALTITAANVISGIHATKRQGIAGATITAGQLIYVDGADGKVKLSDANGSASTKVVDGIALCGSSLNQPVVYSTGDDALVVGATMVVGVTYILGDTPGSIQPDADAVTGDTKIIVGNATSATVMNFAPLVGGVVP